MLLSFSPVLLRICLEVATQLQEGVLHHESEVPAKEGLKETMAKCSLGGLKVLFTERFS